MSGNLTNVLYCGDKLSILRDHIPDESTDPIYLDPSFAQVPREQDRAAQAQL